MYVVQQLPRHILPFQLSVGLTVNNLATRSTKVRHFSLDDSVIAESFAVMIASEAREQGTILYIPMWLQ